MIVMAIGAHPDDIELGMGGTLIKHIKRGDEVIYVVLSKGEKSGNPDKRERELMDVIKYLGIKKYALGDFPDTYFPKYFHEIKDYLEDLIRKYNPRRIYTHSLNDVHQDHSTVARASIIAGRKVGEILCYMGPTNYNRFKPTYFVDISDVINEKIKLLKFHSSQLDKYYANPEYVLGLCRAFGYMSMREYAEGFEVIRFIEDLMR